MTALTINLPDREAQRLRDLARDLGTSPEELAAAAIRERIERESKDFDAVAERVVEKNTELYRRLS
jgi:predicted transcriptional regulator